MDANMKKTALRMIPYGLYVLTAESEDGKTAAATVNWVTQASFRAAVGGGGRKGRLAHPYCYQAGRNSCIECSWQGTAIHDFRVL